MITLVAHVVFVTSVVAAAGFDLATRRIPDLLSVAVVVAFIVAALSVAAPLPLLGQHLLAGVAVFAVGAGCFARGWLGGGDVKLLAACAAWLGWDGLFPFALATVLAGGVLALVALGIGRLPQRLRATAPLGALAAERGLPYAVAIAFGAIFLTGFGQG